MTSFLALVGYTLFSASIFFATLMLTRPYRVTPGSSTSSHYRRILSASHTLEYVKSAVPSAETALNVLYAMAPFFEDDLDEKGKKEQIKAIRTLPFPSHSQPPLPPHGKPRRDVVEDPGSLISRDAELERELEGMREMTAEYDRDGQRLLTPMPPPSRGLISPKSGSRNGGQTTGSDNSQSISGRTHAFSSVEPENVYGTPDSSVRAPSSMRSVSVMPATSYHPIPPQSPTSYLNTIVMGATEGMSAQIGELNSSHRVSLNEALQIETGVTAEIGMVPSLSGDTQTPRTFVVPTNPSSHTASSAPPSFGLSHPPTDSAWYGPQSSSGGVSQRTDAVADNLGFGMGMGMGIGPGMGMVISPQPKYNRAAQYVHSSNASLHHSGRGTHSGYLAPSGVAEVTMGPSEMDPYTSYRRGIEEEVWGVGMDGGDIATGWTNGGSASRHIW